MREEWCVELAGMKARETDEGVFTEKQAYIKTITEVLLTKYKCGYTHETQASLQNILFVLEY
jgi:hypothetical protein